MKVARPRFTPSPLVLALAAAGLSATLAPSALAEDTSAVLEEIIVTARKVSESMQDVSIAVSAFSGAQLDAMMMRDVRELEGLVPNLVIDAVAVAPAGASIYIRGVGTQEVERSFDPAVGVVIDGVPLSFVNGSMRNTFDFAAVEVLRGPQGTLFGRNTTGGVINIVRTRPTGELGARYEIRSGSDDLLDAKAVLNFPITDTISGKLGFASQKDGSNRENILTGDSVGQANNKEVTATVEFTPNDKFSALFTYVYYEDHTDGVPLQNRSSFNTNNPVNPAPDLPCLLGQCGDDVTNIEKMSQDFYSRNVHFDWNSFAVNLEYDMGIGEVVAILGYQETDENVPTDFDATSLNFFHTLRKQDSDQSSAELRFSTSDEWSEKYDFVAGVFYVEDEYHLDQKTSIAAFAGPEGSLFQNPLARHKRNAWAVFGELHYNFTEQLMLTLGGRYTEEEKDYKGSISMGGGSGFPGFVPGSATNDFYVYGQPIWIPIDNASGNESWNEFTPKIGLDYRINDDVLTYANFSRGFRSGGFNGRNSNLANIGPFDPEYVDNYEIGVKSEFLDQTLRVNLAGFYNQYDDKQEEVIEPDGFGGSNTVVRNASSADLWGIEGEITWVASADLRFDANFGYLDASYDDFVADLTGDGNVTDNSNLNLRRVPEWTGGVSATYTKQFGPGVFTAFANYRYTDEYWVEVRNDPRGLLKDRGVFDAVLSYQWEWSDGRDVKLSLWGRDITDEVDYNSAVTIPETIAFSGVSGGRQVGVTVGGNF